MLSLLFPELAILSIRDGQELIMIAGLNHGPIFDHYDQICIHDSGKTMPGVLLAETLCQFNKTTHAMINMVRSLASALKAA